MADPTFDRAAPRIRTLLQARIEFHGGATTVDCTVRDFSDTGARLQVGESVVIPSKFTLYVPKHSRRYQAVLRWHRSGFAGVEFESDQTTPGGDPDPESRVVKLEAEVARLRRMIEAIRSDPSQARLLLEGFEIGSASN